jgi:hypothetical protein
MYKTLIFYWFWAFLGFSVTPVICGLKTPYNWSLTVGLTGSYSFIFVVLIVPLILNRTK